MNKKIFKKMMALALCCSSLFSVVACGGGDTSESSGGAAGMISVAPLTAAELGEGFNAQYLPAASQIRQYSGKIDICLDFEGTQAGWQALAKEYQRLQGNGVIVNVNTQYTGSTYSQKLNNELTNSNTDWDIVEGNLGYGSTQKYCIDMYPAISSYNPYCGADTLWSSVLKSEAYKTLFGNGETYILNSEVMQTCWFVNDVALQAAGKQGYLNANGEVGYPIVWDDLIALCEGMEAAGYTNPLGITLCDASIDSLQFTWLLRVYGDYYYRQFYKYIMGGSIDSVWEEYEMDAEEIEQYAGYGVQFPKLLNMLFDTECSFAEGYVGFTSEVYRDFVSQIAKIKGHLMKDVSSTEFTALRDEFETQSAGKSSPQIILDYQGFGITYEKAETDTFSVGYFDYPQMISGKYTKGDKKGQNIVDPGTITRDIGGNGGFLSIINHLGNSAQNDLNKDFVKFVMSPYGQTIYYKGLAEVGEVPKGLSSVKNELVVIPQEWKNFFDESNETITFSGDVDANHFLSWGVRYAGGYTETQKVIKEYWRNLLMTGIAADQVLTVDAFAAKWDTAVRKDMAATIAYNKWPSDCWLHPEKAI